MEKLEIFLTDTLVNLCMRFVVAIVIIILGHWLIKFIVKKLQKSRLVQRLDAAAQIYLKNAVSIILRVILIISVVAYMGVPMASVTAALSSIGLALGLALQGGLSNIAGGMILLFTHPFKIGDYVIVDDLEGTVEVIGIYYTEIVTIENKKVLIPNGTAANSDIINFSANQNRRLNICFSVAYDSDISKAKNIILEEAKNNEYVLIEPEPVAFVTDHQDSSIALSLQIWTKNENFRIAKSEILQSVKEKFDKENINIPYQQMDIHIKNQ